ncbi:hypothetical protein SLEP1_g36578 [Rubroshorea leprosula]|uniref:Uncharacterized protein n=1 Tax=Rubroshorea leprosula TaxID=152421 RepID=A0AAV5KRY6_9ROSI|nr:hypothetical protein SLEP1_g36578 [Rubroshorea leprosula]
MRERGRERERGVGGGRQARATRTAWNQRYASHRGRSQRRGQEQTNQKQWEIGPQRTYRSQNMGFYDQGMYKQATPYFFSNFPEDWSYEEMWRTFLKFGRVYDIYSPSRKSRSGVRFGFVRFLNVHDIRELERQLDQIWVGGRKLWVNIPKYGDEKKVELKGRIGQEARPIDQSRSYAEALKGHGVGKMEGASEGHLSADLVRRTEIKNREVFGIKDSRKVWKEKGRGASWAGMEYKIKEEDCAWLEGCYVGTTRSVEMVRNLQEKFYMEGYFFCRVRAMGGKMVLLDCEDKEELKDLVEMAADWLGQWFEEIQPWSPELVAHERFVWIRCQGVPLNAWRSDFFEKMGSSWGKFICLDDNTSNKKRFDIARFLISTPITHSISVSRQIKVNGILHNIMFKEEEFTNGFFSLKQDFLPSFNSDSEDHESWSLGTDSDSMDNGFEIPQELGVKNNIVAEKEDDDVVRGMGADRVGRLEVTQEHGEGTIPGETSNQDVVALGLKEQSKRRLDKDPKKQVTRREGEEAASLGPAQSVTSPDRPNKKEKPRSHETEQEAPVEEEIDPFWKGFESEEGRLKEWMCRRKDKIRKRKKRKNRSCRSVYSIDAADEEKIQEKNSRGRQRIKEKERRATPATSSNYSSKIAGESIGDSDIRNCNRILERLSKDQLPVNIWNFAKNLGVVAENEQQVTQRIEDMEKRDKEEKANMEQAEAIGKKRETKLEIVDKNICRRVWGTDDFDWVVKASNGLSGGLLSIWNSKVFRKIDVIEGENFLGVSGLWGEEDSLVYIINIYSPCQLPGKRALWEELQGLITSRGGKWCLAGDFNAVRKEEERAGCRELTREMRDFDDFIQNTGLIDLPLMGRKYTWYNSNGQYMSRIDRFLLTEEWILKWSDVKQWGLNRSVSDHCPILLKTEKMDWGPKPFKFFDAWLDQPRCKEIIREVWKSTKVKGWYGFKLKEKLKRTKNQLKEWSRNSISEVDRKIKEAEKEIATTDEKGEKGQLSTQDIDQRKSCFLDLWKNLKIKESMWQQKSRKMWLKEGDANTKFFHRCAQGRYRRNEILCIHINGEQHTGVAKIKDEVARYFEELFTEEKWERPKLDGIGFNKISEVDNDTLTAAFSEKEIKETVWECEDSKSPGPDGFNFRFVKAMWEDIKADVVGFVQEFQKHGKIVKGSNASFIVLIPKVENPQKIEEYRPISLIGVMYKILAKLLANRLRKVIGEQQMAFIRGRQLAEGVVIANEVIDEAKRNKKKSFIFKVDFEKAYDKVCWGFIDYMLTRMGFCGIWRGWIQECLRSSSVSVIINGSPTRQFSVTKGIRQGDPLSPFLFLIVAEGLNGMMAAAIEKKMYKGVKVGNGDLMVSHLQFADDTMFFGEATEENIWAIKCIVRTFEMVSGLKINYTKSHLMGVNVEEGWKEKMAYRLCCKGKDLPVKYLGIPIGGNQRRIAMWKPLVESVKKKLAPWKGRHLSFGGRITLINSVLSSLPVFLMSVYLLPKGIIHFIDKIRKNFLWGGEGEGRKINWVKWEKVCKNKQYGGLGVRELRKFNLALMGKWWGRLARKDQGLWDKVIASKYGKRGGHWLDWVREGRGIGSLWWRDVCCLNNVDEENEGWLIDGFKLNLGEGKEVSFWWDDWGGEGCLANLFPRLYSLSTGKEKECYQMGEEENGSWKWYLGWRRDLFNWEREEAEELQKKIEGKRIRRDIPDTWKWEHSKDGNYSTKTAYRHLANDQNGRETTSIYKRVWNPIIPSKISAFNWLLMQDRIPTKSNLQKRGIISGLGDGKCALCEGEIEDSSHLFLKCRVAKWLWKACGKWWGISVNLENNCWNSFEQFGEQAKEACVKEGLDCIWNVVVWSVWLARNQKVFRDSDVNIRVGNRVCPLRG